MNATETALFDGVQRIVLRPGEALLFRVPHVTEQMAVRIRELVERFSFELGWKVPVMIVSDDVDVTVLSREEPDP